MPTLSRTVFQSPASNTFSNRDSSRAGGFSFNRTLQQVSDESSKPTNRSMADDIDMDSALVPRMRQNSLSREPQSHSFGYFPQQTSSSNIFTTKPSNFQKEETPPNVSSSIYSKDSELSQSDRKQYESPTFVFKNIPIRPPTQQLCF